MEQSVPSMPDSSPVSDEEDAEDRLLRSRDRNREHARKTRLRKKAQLQALQSQVKELQCESRKLKQTVEECSIASILLGLSSGGSKDQDEISDLNSLSKNTDTERTFFTMNGKRKRFLSDAGDCGPQPMKLNIKGQPTLVGGGNGKAHINWKTGVYLDEDGVEKQLTLNELEKLRRERNRMHAKMTRDRKKVFINSVEKTIKGLEADNKRMRGILAKQAQGHAKNSNLCTVSICQSVPQSNVPVAPLTNSVQMYMMPLPTQINSETPLSCLTTPDNQTSRDLQENAIFQTSTGFTVVA